MFDFQLPGLSVYFFIINCNPLIRHCFIDNSLNISQQEALLSTHPVKGSLERIRSDLSLSDSVKSNKPNTGKQFNTYIAEIPLPVGIYKCIVFFLMK